MERTVDGAIRLGRAWKALSRERRAAAIAAAVLWLTLFLPWYQASVVSRSARGRNPVPENLSMTGWGVFSLVQALVLVLSLGTLLVLFLRAEGRGFRLPGGDGWSITVAGALSTFLVILGLFSAPSPASRGQYVLSTGLEWGIFLALIAAGALTWAGGRIRRSLEDDPFLAEQRRAREAEAAAEPWPADERSAAPAPSSAPSPGRPASPAPAVPGVGPLTAAAAKTPATDATEDAAPPQPRSSWRPGERPGWSDPEKPMGWLTAPPGHVQEEPDEEGDGEDATNLVERSGTPHPADPPPPTPHRAPAPRPAGQGGLDNDQLTIPLDREE